MISEQNVHRNVNKWCVTTLQEYTCSLSKLLFSVVYTVHCTVYKIAQKLCKKSLLNFSSTVIRVSRFCTFSPVKQRYQIPQGPKTSYFKFSFVVPRFPYSVLGFIYTLFTIFDRMLALKAMSFVQLLLDLNFANNSLIKPSKMTRNF